MPIYKLSVACVLLVAACGPTGPSPVSSPSPSYSRLIGALNPDVTQATIRTTICVAGWTDRIRPPASYTTALKKRQLPTGARLADYEEDHVIPLGLGGAPHAEANLRPVPIKRARADDVWETRLHRQVCDGTLTLAAAQVRISDIKRGKS